MNALLEHFQGERVLLLLDNFEPVVNPETQEITDSELDEALCTLVRGPHHMVNALITTRVAPRELNLCEPGRQRVLTLDEGLESPYAENILREMDEDGKLGLKAREENDPLLQRAREKTRGYPRALEALFAILSSDRYTTLEELLELPLLPENVVEALVGEAFSRLDATAQKVMQALAVYNRPVTPAAVDYLLQPHLPEIDSAPVLNRLVNMHFVRREAGRYYLHPVDHDYAFGLITESREQRVENSDSPQTTNPQSLVSDHLSFTQHNLLTRAADYFAQARKPRAEWKKLDDLPAQLAEFDLRCAAGDYDTAASVLLEIDFDYLLLWGHYRLMIELHEKLQGKISDSTLERISTGNLGTALRRIGQVRKSIEYFHKALKSARDNKNRQGESAWLGNLGSTYANLGETRKAIEFYEQALVIAREIGARRDVGVMLNNLGAGSYYLGNIDKAVEFYEQYLAIVRETGDREGEGTALGNLAESFANSGKYTEAIDRAVESIKIAKEISSADLASCNNCYLACAYLFSSNLKLALLASETALQHDVPLNNHNASALHGIIALRQGDGVIARQAFTRAIVQADEILAKTPEYYDALDAKGLATCGLALTKDLTGLTESCPDVEGSDEDLSGLIPQTIETFRAARKIAPHAGIVKSVLRLFDELAKCDPEGLLEGVREAVEGKG